MRRAIAEEKMIRMVKEEDIIDRFLGFTSKQTLTMKKQSRLEILYSTEP